MITRRAFLGAALAAPVWASHADRLGAWQAASGARLLAPPIDADRIRRHLEALSVFGRPDGGSFADGVSRVGYSDADVAGRAYVQKLMRDAGLEPRIDPAGNIFARRAGSDASLAPVLFGSHIDSVPRGGNFDGDLGTLAAIEAAQILNERKVVTRRPLEIVVWANEEGVAFGNGLAGSRAVAGKLVDGELDHVWEGVRKADAIRKIGGQPERIAEAVRPRGWFHAYLELHIEQGGTLDKAGIPVGVVEGIVSIDRYEAVIQGIANHAGTTPMPERHDALIAASKLTLAVNDVVTSEPGRQVGTVGQLAVTPNAPNVVPGLVRHTIELRDLSSEKIARLADAIKARATQIAADTRTTITITRVSHHEPALATADVQRAIEAAAERIGLGSTRLPSGAGHDAQMMAQLGPMGMIFVPSVGGVSHAPQELTRWDDCARGAQVLVESVLALDRTA
jgi:beta-ureidopropionase / N-carbamoyl-L-amino-acid hydrolase